MIQRPSAHKSYQLLDAWRGVASLAVVAYHVSQMVAYGNPNPVLRQVCSYGSLGALGVQIFFVVSGYCIAASAASILRRDQNAWDFLRARIQRVYPTCWIALALAASFYLTGSLLAKSGHTGKNIFTQFDLLHAGWQYYLANLTLTQIVTRQSLLLVVCWTLCYEVAFYLIVGLFLLFHKAITERWLLNALHLVTLMAMATLLIAPSRAFYPFDLWPQFGLGILVYDVLKHKDHLAPKLWIGIVSAQVVTFVLHSNYGIGYMQQGSRLSFSLSLGFAVLLIGLYRWDVRLSSVKPLRLLSSVGLFSYSLYLTHTITIRLIHQAAKATRLPLEQPLGAIIFFALAVLAAVLFARFFYRYCEQPFLKPKQRLVIQPLATQGLVLDEVESLAPLW